VPERLGLTDLVRPGLDAAGERLLVVDARRAPGVWRSAGCMSTKREPEGRAAELSPDRVTARGAALV
jgi:hypothetical protein